MERPGWGAIEVLDGTDGYLGMLGLRGRVVQSAQQLTAFSSQ